MKSSNSRSSSCSIKKLLKNIIKILSVSSLLVFSINASANVIENGSFESPQIQSQTWRVFSSIDGWQTISGAGIEIQNDLLVKAQDGHQYVELDSHNNSAMTQELNDLDVGAWYNLSFWYRARTNNGGNDNGISVHWDDKILGDLALDVSDVLAKDGGWVEYTQSLRATAETMFLSFAAIGKNNSLGGFIDNVSVTAVSEPGLAHLLGLGVLGLVFTRRRTR